jgi:signal transduction histidine kinase
MKKFIITAFALIFSLFAIGSGIAVHNLLTITTDLRSLIDLHEIEDIRQELGFSIQRIQTYTYASATDFSKNLDEIIDHASVIDKTLERCHDCHHVPTVQQELEDTESLISEYQEKLSYLITFVSSRGERRQEKQDEISFLGDIILTKVQGMVHRAGTTIASRTNKAMQDIDRSYMILGATLLCTFLAAFFVARSLTRHITGPIDELLTATHKIADGELGYTTDYRAGSEFGMLINTFNDMSLSLANKEKKIQSNLTRLNKLNKVTLPLHAAKDIAAILNYMWTSIAEVVGVKNTGFMLLADSHEEFTLEISSSATVPPRATSVRIMREDVLQVFNAHKGRPIMHNNGSNPDDWPFPVTLPYITIKNYVIIWLVNNNELIGALFALNKTKGDFLEEDQNILGILANNISVALENIRLYNDLQYQMEELKNTQRQLIEAEKLTALGTLAGGIAHDFNNILCGMIGYLAILKKNRLPGEQEYEILNTIEQAGFRAASLIKQLLTFARQEMFELQPVDINENINNVVTLVKNTVSKLITISLKLDASLPGILGDPAQLEQVIMNLCVNARDAMPDGGNLLIESEEVHLDENFCQQHSDATPGHFIKVTVSDSGTGIDANVLSRIFEPFFTTKEFGKGTGLGLSMVYGIVRSHNGFCTIKSKEGEGTDFSFYLPIPPERLNIEKIPLEDAKQITQTKGASLLIVDDEVTIVSMLTIHLQDLGYTVYHAENGQQALDVLAEHKDAIDLIILDINMPVMGGEEAFLKMRAIQPGVKVLIATGYAYSGHAQKIIELGANGFIQKPFRSDDITEKIDEILAA